MRIEVNGEVREVRPGCPVADLVAALGITGRFAVEVNGAVVPRSTHAEVELQPQDRVEIVRAIGGG
ncbi:MAG: sulfur carrier protein ThiS [Gammaproteobacteria bacterium]